MLWDTTIVITTHDREKKQTTLVGLPEPIRKRVRLAIYRDEEDNYRRLWPNQHYWLMPKSVRGLHEKRKYLIENTRSRYLILMDDDFRFCYRPTMQSPKLVYLQPDDKRFTKMFLRMRRLCETYAHVGISHRAANHGTVVPYKYNTRIAGVFMYDLKVLRQEGVELGRVVLMDDFDTILQLLRKGCPNVVMYRWCYNHMGYSNAKGGCSNYRTVEMQNRDAKILAKLHHPFVRLVQKHSTTWQGMKDRTDVVVYWKKAFASSSQPSVA